LGFGWLSNFPASADWKGSALTLVLAVSSRMVSYFASMSVFRADAAETKNFIYFYLGPTAVLLWKTS